MGVSIRLSSPFASVLLVCLSHTCLRDRLMFLKELVAVRICCCVLDRSMYAPCLERESAAKWRNRPAEGMVHLVPRV